MEAPELIRNVAVVGALHHGKTLLMDLLIQQTQVRQPAHPLPVSLSVVERSARPGGS